MTTICSTKTVNNEKWGPCKMHSHTHIHSKTELLRYLRSDERDGYLVTLDVCNYQHPWLPIQKAY